MTHQPQKLSSEILDEAAMWVARTEAGTHGAAVEAALQDWLAKDPAHAEAFRRMKGFWKSDTLDALTPAHARARRPVWRNPLAWAAPIAAAIALFLLVPSGEMAPQYEASFATEIAQTNEATLPDGTVVSMNAATSMRVTIDDEGRHADLASGEAFFDVTHDEDHPFTVTSGTAQIRVLGTSFNVNRLSGHSELAVFTGRVEVTALDNPAAHVVIRPGQAVAIWPGQIKRLPDFDTAGDLTWRQDWLDAREIRLSDMLEHINRYARVPVQLADDDLASLTVAGRFRLSQPEETLAMLSAIYDLRIEGRDGYRLLTGS